MNEYTKFSSGRWNGFCLKDFRNELRNLDEWLASKQTETIREFPLRKICVLKINESEKWYIKTLNGLGDYHQTLMGALKWRFRPSRAIHILKISEELERNGFSCPKVIMAARMRKWSPFGSPTDLLIMTEASGRLVSNWLTGADGLPKLEGQARLDMLKRIGTELARLHKAGFVHGDCHPGNYYWNENDEHFCYIDNDRTRRYAKLNVRGAQRNLISAGFYLLNTKKKRLPHSEWEILLSEYLSSLNFASQQKKDDFGHSIAKGIKIRLKRGK